MTFANAENIGGSIGTKALNLIKMKQQGFSVPKGFVVSPYTFRQFLEINGLTLADDHLQAKIMKSEMPDDMVSDIVDAFNDIKQSFDAVAVRSSSSAEDWNNASFAGLYETYLNVKTQEDLISKVKACWASVFAERVQTYYQTMNINSENLSMSVVVQGLVTSEIAGVIFSQNPVSGQSDELMINASYGLGESIVSGIVTPDTVIVNKITHEMDKHMGLKEVKILPSDKETKEVATTASEQNHFCLEMSAIQQLTEQTKQLETFFGHAVDMEFGIQHNQIYLLQVRPITTTSSAEVSKQPPES